MSYDDVGEKLFRGEISGREYFQQILEEGLKDGTLVSDELGMVHRSEAAPPLKYLPGHEPKPLLTDEQNARIDNFLKMPRLDFPEDTA